MVVWALVILAAWILLSLPVAVIVGRIFAARPDAVTDVGRNLSGDPHRVAYLSRVESRRCAASRWPHEARVLCTSRRRVAVAHRSVARSAG